MLRRYLFWLLCLFLGACAAGGVSSNGSGGSDGGGGGASSSEGSLETGAPVEIPITIAKDINGVDPVSVTFEPATDGTNAGTLSGSLVYTPPCSDDQESTVLEIVGNTERDRTDSADCGFSFVIPQTFLSLEIAMVACGADCTEVSYPVIAVITPTSQTGVYDVQVRITNIDSDTISGDFTGGDIEPLKMAASSTGNLSFNGLDSLGANFLGLTTVQGGGVDLFQSTDEPFVQMFYGSNGTLVGLGESGKIYQANTTAVTLPEGSGATLPSNRFLSLNPSGTVASFNASNFDLSTMALDSGTVTASDIPDDTSTSLQCDWQSDTSHFCIGRQTNGNYAGFSLTEGTPLTRNVAFQLPTYAGNPVANRANGTGIVFECLNTVGNQIDLCVGVNNSDNFDFMSGAYNFKGPAYNSSSGLVIFEIDALSNDPAERASAVYNDLKDNRIGVINPQTFTAALLPLGIAPVPDPGNENYLYYLAYDSTQKLQVNVMNLRNVTLSANALDRVSYLAPVTGITATAGSTDILLQWNRAAGATSYRVYRGTSSGVTKASPLVATTTDAILYRDTGLNIGTTYYYAVESVGSGTFVSDLSTEVSATPVISPSIKLGNSLSCALRSNGTAKCWGTNASGELSQGNGTVNTPAYSSKALTMKDQNGATVTNIVEMTTKALRLSNGNVMSWGYGDVSYGSLGNGTNNSNFPYPVSVIDNDTGNTLTGATQLTSGGNHSCALVSGGVKCWGYNYDGETGIGSFSQGWPLRTVLTATDVVGLGNGSNVTAIAAGDYHTCALLSDGTVKCWGWDVLGGLGIGRAVAGVDYETRITYRENSPKTVVTSLGANATYDNGTGDDTVLNNMVSIWAGGYSTCAKKNDGAVYCWGRNDYGLLNDGTGTIQSMPVVTNGLSNATSGSLNEFFHCAVLPSGLKCVGHNGSGELGIGSTDAATPLYSLQSPLVASNAVSVSIGFFDSYLACAILDTDRVQCWGKNNVGQLGDNSTTNRTSPVYVIDDATNANLDVTP